MEFYTQRILDTDPEEASALVSALRDEPALSIFDGQMQVVTRADGEQSHRLEFRDLAEWLTLRGYDVGGAQAVSELDRYMSEEEFPCTDTLALAGLLAPSEHFDIGDGIRLIPFSDLPDSVWKASLQPRMPPAGLLPHAEPPQAALVREYMAPKRHEAGDLDPGRPLRRLDLPDLTEVALLLTIIGPSTAPIVRWVQPAAEVPCATSAGASPFLIEALGGSAYEFSAEDSERARAICSAFHSLPESVTKALRVPLNRLNLALRRINPVDAAIDLGIALESLFLSDQEDQRTELTFRLRLRAARFMASEPKERRELASILGKFYAVRSAAAHTGMLPSDIGGVDTKVLMERTQRLIADALERIIMNGQPDWQEVQFS